VSSHMRPIPHINISARHELTLLWPLYIGGFAITYRQSVGVCQKNDAAASNEESVSTISTPAC
jgi:hypothetical protein